MPGTSILVDRFPTLGRLPRADLGVVESPVEQWVLGDAALWVKRDDLDAPRLGGNKVRALEFLLGGLPTGRGVLTMGGVGSTHVLATAVHAASLGHPTRAYRWPHEWNDLTATMSDAIEAACVSAPVLATPVHAWAAAGWRRLTHQERWIPFGGTSPLGMVGHFAAALELAEQVRMGALPEPREVFVALGSGGTAAGLLAGFGAAGLATGVVAVRCGPTTGADHARILWLARRLGAFLARHGARYPPARDGALRVDHSAWSGAYARPHPGAAALQADVRERLGVGLDATYSAKACYAASLRTRQVPGPVLFWHTFDARWLARARVANR